MEYPCCGSLHCIWHGFVDVTRLSAGGYSVGQGAQVDGTTSLSAPTDGNTTQLGTYTDAEGTVYTGDGFTVSDSYTCGSGDCGGFTIVDTYTHAVAGPVAAPSHALAAPVMAAMPEGKSTTVRATPAHFVMTMHALTFGVLSATSKMLAGESDSAWTADFKASASQGAQTVTPVGKYVLDKVFA
mmetsp:Transcript_65011/g.105350  ORF Transcript_65011/g.105350 Transcript_65011/m.105350 type:complete len:184 (-) Transcript_65011:355-906(-)